MQVLRPLNCVKNQIHKNMIFAYLNICLILHYGLFVIFNLYFCGIRIGIFFRSEMNIQISFFNFLGLRDSSLVFPKLKNVFSILLHLLFILQMHLKC